MRAAPIPTSKPEQKDWKGGKRSAVYALGASNRSAGEREELDFYATPPSATEKLLSALDAHGEKLSHVVWEPATGMGHVARVLEAHGYVVEESDVVNRKKDDEQGSLIKISDFLQASTVQGGAGAIVTNPPYVHALPFIKKANELLPQNGLTCMLLKVQFLEGKERGKELYKSGLNPKWVFVFSERINCAKGGDFEKESEKGGQIAYAWYVWQKGWKGTTSVDWI